MKVTVYSAPGCPWCVKAKEWLEENKVKFELVDLSKAENRERAIALIQKSGSSGVPQIEIDGEIVVGFDVERIKELLKL